jgi:hypothetical protein
MGIMVRHISMSQQSLIRLSEPPPFLDLGRLGFASVFHIIEAKRNRATTRRQFMNATPSCPFEIQTVGILHSVEANREKN